MNLTELAFKLGYSKSYFYAMKSYSPEIFKWYMSFDKDMEISHRKAGDKCIETRNELCDIIFDMEWTWGKKHNFSIWLYKEGILTHPQSFNTMSLLRFATVERSFHYKYFSDKKIIEGYKKWQSTIERG